MKDELIRKESENTYVISADIAVRDVNRALNLDLPEDGDWTSLAGLSLAVAGRIPKNGDVLRLPSGVTIEVIEATARRVRSVRIRVPSGSVS